MSESNLSAPVAKLIERLELSVKPGQRLDGWKLHVLPVERIDGLKDFPFVAVELPTWSEAYRSAKVVLPTLSVVLNVGTAKEKTGLAGHLKALSDVLNAVELNVETPRVIDPGLSGTILRPFEVAARETQTLDISLLTKLTLTIEAKPALRGRR